MLGELIGTALLVFIGCGSTIALSTDFTANNPEAAVLKIALCFGFSVAVIVSFLGDLSGGHINPAVTLSFLIARRLSIIRSIVYIIAQTAGAIAGAGLLKAMTPDRYIGGLGTNVPNSWVTVSLAQGVITEALITFLFVLVIFGVCDPHRKVDTGPLFIGLTIATCHIFAIPYTGAAMNPARAIGPCVILGAGDHWTYHWIYWVGPILGGLVAALLYELVFATNASTKKFVAWISKYNYDNEDWLPDGQKKTD